MIPRSALWLGIAGLIPFLFGASVILGWIDIPDPFVPSPGNVTLTPEIGIGFISSYGVVILSFMSGVLWGFATKSDSFWPYALSVIPALWAFFTGGDLLSLAVGFTALLCLDFAYYRYGMTPVWWMQLRLPLTSIVVACLLIGVFA